MESASLIDDLGEIWIAGSRKLPEALGTRLSASELNDYFLTQMGFVAFRDRGTVVDVTFEPQTVSPVAIIGLLYKLAGMRGRPVALRTCSDDIGVRVMHDRGRVIAYLSDIVEARRGGPRYAKQIADLARSAFVSCWEVAEEVVASDISSDVRHRVLEKLFKGSFTLNRLDQSDGQYRVVDWCSKFGHLDSAFATLGPGLSYYELTDSDYGRWIAETFKEYATAKERRVEAVTALITGPGAKAKQYNYNRLVLPVTRVDERLLLVATDVR